MILLIQQESHTHKSSFTLKKEEPLLGVINVFVEAPAPLMTTPALAKLHYVHTHTLYRGHRETKSLCANRKQQRQEEEVGGER